jgi:hypothetical protein
MYQVKLTTDKGEKRTFSLQDFQLWIVNGNLSGMGGFSKVKIKHITDSPKEK